jgi:hypothetical protein
MRQISSLPQTIAKPAFGGNHLRAQLFAQAANMHLNSVAFDIAVKGIEPFF